METFKGGITFNKITTCLKKDEIEDYELSRAPVGQ